MSQPVGRVAAVTPQLSVFIACSLDGYIATPEGSLDWLTAAARPNEDYGYESFMEGIDALAMGRGTYDHIAAIDPLPFGDKPVFVFTHSPPPDRDGVMFWSRDPLEAAAEWSALGLRRVYVDGGFLISSFLREGLIHDLTITLVPLVLGDGQRLFHPGIGTTRLTLQETTAFPSGMVNLRYTRAEEETALETPVRDPAAG